jgi:hypothetical protein
MNPDRVIINLKECPNCGVKIDCNCKFVTASSGDICCIDCINEYVENEKNKDCLQKPV